MQADEPRAPLELRERRVEPAPGEGLLRLVRLVRPADEDDVGSLVHELDVAREVLVDGAHREREDALALEEAGGRERGGLDLVLGELDADPAEVGRERRPRTRRVVRDEAEPVPVGAKLRHRFGRSRDDDAGEVQHTVDVEQDRGHCGRV